MYINLPVTAKDLDGNVIKHLINPLSAVKRNKGKVSWRGTDPDISHLRRKIYHKRKEKNNT